MEESNYLEVHRNFRYRIYPTDQQIVLLEKHFFSSNQAWNKSLALKINDIDKNSQLPKDDRIYLKDAEIEKAVNLDLKQRGLSFNTGVVQGVLKNQKKAFQQFFQKKGKSDSIGFPTFALSNEAQQSFPFKNQGISWTTDYLKIMKQKIKWDFHRELPIDAETNKPAKLNGLVIKRFADGKYFAILNLSYKIDPSNIVHGRECALDMNIENIGFKDSDGKSELIPLPDFSKSKYSKKYKTLQQQLSRRYKKKNFSKNTKRAQKKLNKINRKIVNQKENFFHHLSKELTNNYDRITIEDLQIAKMKESKSTSLNRKISDSSWNSLIQKLHYKAEMQNVIIRKIHPAYTSQRCSKCGHISKNNRKTQSVFLCEHCQHTENADLNSPQNMLDYDKWSLEQKTLIAQWNHIEQSESLEDLETSIRSPIL
jgi:putative transposase